MAGNPGAVSYDQSLLIVDSTLFDKSFYDRASYVLGNEDFEFNQPIEVRMAHERDDVAIYRRKNGSIWEELPSISKDGEIFTLSEKAGYFKLGPKLSLYQSKQVFIKLSESVQSYYYDNV